MEYKKVLVLRKLRVKIDACKFINVVLVFMLQFNIFSFDIKSDKKFSNQNFKLSPQSKFKIAVTKSDKLSLSNLYSKGDYVFGGSFIQIKNGEELHKNINFNITHLTPLEQDEINQFYSGNEIKSIKQIEIMPLKLEIYDDDTNSLIGVIYISMDYEKPEFKLQWINIYDDGHGYGELSYALLKMFLLSIGGSGYKIEANLGAVSDSDASRLLFFRTFDDVVKHESEFGDIEVEFVGSGFFDMSNYDAKILPTPDIIKMLKNIELLEFSKNHIYEISS